jgi:hypothetical protein
MPSDIAKMIERRPWPSYEERMAVFDRAARTVEGAVRQQSALAATCPCASMS